MGLIRKFFIALLIVLISAYSYNAERTSDPDLAKRYFQKGVESLKILNYLDALVFFSKAYSINHKSYYGELAYLYLGKSYALYSYAYGSKKGVLAAVGYLNQYPFHYKVPRFIHVQREFVGDSYLLLQWYETAKNIYANLYGETERVEYMIKFGYASALSGSVEGYNYLKKLNIKGVPQDYLDLYYMTMGFYNFNLGRYGLAIEYLSYAMNLNTYLREDPHLLFRMGVSNYKLGDWRKALLYLELTLRKDPLNTYEEKGNFYLARINLETNNFREAFLNIEALTKEDRLFYRKLPQILYSSLWLYDEFLKVYGSKLGNYRDKLLQLGWLNVEDVYGELPAMGIYYFSLKGKSLSEEEKEFLRLKKLTLREFFFENELFTMDVYVKKAREPLKGFLFYKREDAGFLKDIYALNKNNYLKLFGSPEGLELLARSLVFLGEHEAETIVGRLENKGLKEFLRAKLHIIKGNFEPASKLLSVAIKSLKGEDLLEAELLLAYLNNSPGELESVAQKIDFKKERFSHYAPLILNRLADLYYDRGNFKKALSYYKRVVQISDEGEDYWWSMFRIALIGELTEDKETLKWVVKEAEKEDNIWSKVIRTLWEG